MNCETNVYRLCQKLVIPPTSGKLFSLAESAWRVGLLDASLLSTETWTTVWRQKFSDAIVLGALKHKAKTDQQWGMAQTTFYTQAKRLGAGNLTTTLQTVLKETGEDRATLLPSEEARRAEPVDGESNFSGRVPWRKWRVL